MKATNYDLIHTTGNATCAYWTYDPKQKQWVPLDEQFFKRHIDGYGSLCEHSRKKARRKFINNCQIIKKIKIPETIPNITDKQYDKHDPDALSVLSICNLFKEQEAGYLLCANLLCGMHVNAIRKAAPEFQPVLAINSNSSPQIIEPLTTIIRAIYRTTDWYNDSHEFTQKHILDYRSEPGDFPKHIQDFTRGKASVKQYQKFKYILPYSGSAVLVIGADSMQIREAVPHLVNAAVLLLNSAPGDLNPTKLQVTAYSPEIAGHIRENRKKLASLFRWWWGEALKDEDSWAQRIVQAARASFGKPDSKYKRVELDPKKLRNAILYQVLLSFLDEVEAAELMTAEELAPYRQGAKEVFDPAPPEPVQPRHAEDPDVFLEIMKTLVDNPPAPIVAEDAQFVKKDKHLAAWRTISEERCLVFLEADWANAYSKLAKARKDVDCSYFHRENWARDIQKLLCERGLIKAPSSGHRYRYDLMGNGTRDTTYVVAIPAHLLEN